MANSVVEICNLALTRIGSSLITALTEETKAARLCNLFWPTVLDFVLEYRRAGWKCANRRALIAKTDEVPPFGWDYTYTLPTVPYCLKVLEFIPADTAYLIEGRKLYTNTDSDEDDVGIIYVSRLDNPSEFGATLTEALVLRMAAVLAYALAQNGTLKDSLMEEFGRTVIMADQEDAMEGYVEDEAGMDEWIDAGG